MKMNKLISLTFFFTWAGVSQAQVLTLDSVLNKIRDSNPELKTFSSRISALNTYSLMSNSWMPPNFSTGLWQVPFHEFKSGMQMYSLTQMIPNPANQRARYEYMRSMAGVEEKSMAVKRNELLSNAKMNYTEWVILEKKYTMLLQVDTLLDYLIKAAENRYSFNKEKLNTVYKAKGDLYDIRNMETMVKSEIEMRNIELNILMNIDRSIVFKTDTNLIMHPYEFQKTDTALIRERSDLKKIDAMMQSYKLEQKSEQSRTKPEFGITVNYMQSLGGMSDQYSVMGMITFPFAPWSAREYKAKTAGLNYELQSVSYERSAMLTDISGMILSLQVQMRSAYRQWRNYSENIVPNYYNSYQAAFLAYQQNSEDLVMVLDGLKMYRMSKLSELDALGKYYELQLKYEKELEIQ
jgi:cobalt-zinc-cadmium efflux system outer membrane protein